MANEIRKSNFSRARRGFGLGFLVSFPRGPGVPRGPSGQARTRLCAAFFSPAVPIFRVRLSSLSSARHVLFFSSAPPRARGVVHGAGPVLEIRIQCGMRAPHMRAPLRRVSRIFT